MAGAAPYVGHVSGATPLAALEPAARAGAETFGLHPLQTFAPPPASVELRRRRLRRGRLLARRARAREATRDVLGMEPFEIDDEGRPAYHAAASIASNFLVTLEAAAERVAAAAGLDAQRGACPAGAAGAPNGRELGRARPRAGAHRARGARR